MNEIIFIVEEAPDGGFVAKAVGSDIFTQAENEQQLKEVIRDAIICHFEKEDIPDIVHLHYVKEETFSMLTSVAEHFHTSKEAIINDIF